MVTEEQYKCSKCQKSIYLDYQGKGFDLHYNVGDRVNGNDKTKFRFCASCWESGEKNNYLGNKKYWVSELEENRRSDIQEAQEESSNDSPNQAPSQNPNNSPTNNSKTVAIVGLSIIFGIILVGFLIYRHFTSESKK